MSFLPLAAIRLRPHAAAMHDDPLTDFTRRTIEVEGEARTVYVAGEGPAVIVMAEMPGISPDVARFARWVRAAGLTVYLPSLFGRDGAYPEAAAGLAVVKRACVSAEFRALEAGRSSPITAWLRGLARIAHGECGGPGVGAVGMCLTGNFALAMMLGAPVIAPVLAQPSLPVPLTARHRAGLHASPAELAAAHEQIDHHGARILALRFAGDPLCPAARFERLRHEFADAVETIEIADRFANPKGPLPPHSVLTNHLIDEQGQPTRAALDRTLAFLGEQLRRP